MVFETIPFGRSGTLPSGEASGVQAMSALCVSNKLVEIGWSAS